MDVTHFFGAGSDSEEAPSPSEKSNGPFSFCPDMLIQGLGMSVRPVLSIERKRLLSTTGQDRAEVKRTTYLRIAKMSRDCEQKHTTLVRIIGGYLYPRGPGAHRYSDLLFA